MHPVAEKAARAALDAGHALTLDDVRELDRIAGLAARADLAAKECTLILADTPVCIGNVKLWPLGFGAMIWANRILPLIEHEPYAATALAAFALAHGRQPEILNDLYEPEKAAAAIDAWAKKVTCTSIELNAAMELVDPAPEKIKRASSAVMKRPVTTIVEALMAEYKLPENHWLWETSIRRNLAILDQSENRRRAENGKAPKEESELRDITTALMEALRDFDKRWKGVVPPPSEAAP